MKTSFNAPRIPWLAHDLDDTTRPLVGKVSATMGWDIAQAFAFCVALLEDVNAHTEAKDVNSLLNAALGEVFDDTNAKP